MLDDIEGRMLRPEPLVRAAEIAAGSYRRRHDLPAALAERAARPGRRLLAVLCLEEAALERQRRAGAPGYRPARHLQVLAAYLAECRALGVAPAAGAAAIAPPTGDDQAKASGSASLRRARKSASPSAMPGSRAGC